MHCHGKTYGNVYVITFRVWPFGMYTHFFHRSCHYFIHRRVSVWTFSSAITFDFMAPKVVKHVHFKLIFRVGRSKWDPESAVFGWWQECFLCSSSELHHAISAKLARRIDQAVHIYGAPNRPCRRIMGTFWLILFFQPEVLWSDTWCCHSPEWGRLSFPITWQPPVSSWTTAASNR
jgi:hypothetical protein